ncbi:MAG: ComEC/Rec2 family competence protein [Candidatus Alkaliphilus sp. MAG34]|nr:MBL fold metallo-hydrolase [Clostridiales bacterium]
MKNNIKITIALIIILSLTLSILVGCNRASDILSIHMIDVGQGESILIITPNNKTILIDAGEASQGKKVKSYLLKHGVNKIDLLIGTHPHTDHIGGLPEIVNNFNIKKIIMPQKLHTSATFEKLLAAIESNGFVIDTPRPNSIIKFDKDINLHFLGPIKDYGDNLNLWSIVFKLDYKDKSFLFTGDMEREAEMDLIDTYSKNDLKANVLNIGHHGSNASTTQQFLDYVSPEVALISLGSNNPYNHPHKEVITRLEQSGVFIYRTDLQQTVVVLSDGRSIWSNQAPVNKKATLK